MEKPCQSNTDLGDPFLSLKPLVQTLGCAWAIPEFWHNEMQQLQIILASTHAVMQCANTRYLLYASTHCRTVWVSQEAEKHQFQQCCMIKGALEGWKRSRIPLSQCWLSLQLWQINSVVQSVTWRYCSPTAQESTELITRDSQRLCPRNYYIKKLNSDRSKTPQVALNFDIWSFQPTEALTAAVFSLTFKHPLRVTVLCIQQESICSIQETGSLAFLRVSEAPTKLMGPKKQIMHHWKAHWYSYTSYFSKW